MKKDFPWDITQTVPRIQSLIIVIFSETLFILFDVFNSFKYLIITFCNYNCVIYIAYCETHATL